MVRDVVRGYAIQEGFELNRLKNDQCRYTAKCFNDTCDWRIHVFSLLDGRSFIIRSICGGHIQCRRGKKNKEAISLWIAVVAGKSINLNPTISAKSLKNELHDKFRVECSSQSVYRAKKKVLKTLRADHENSYAQIRKYGNILIKMNPGSFMKIRGHVPRLINNHLGYCRRTNLKKLREEDTQENKVVGILVNLSTIQVALFSNIRCFHLEVILMFVRK
ncbi:hypothetical protein Dsin_021234 [Dipteronia sinensis]|uniref:Transposase MuDR plant domain-containing protein n=1 Tax=Dipteronia sinensis TaxID=43782 RepID=A0AAD9ZZT4_9ROSI|nr:hypothetical protein Dsin_021234 [Dipteronia sinensis]